MLGPLDANTERFLTDLRSGNARIERAQREIGSGKRLTTPSDDPDRVSDLLQKRAELARLDWTKANLTRLKTEADTAESSLQSAVTLLDRVRTLGAQGASGNMSAGTRNTIAGEIGDILLRFAGLANTQVDGRFVFSGDADQTPSFEMDLFQNPPWTSFQGSVSTRQALHPTGVSFPISKSGEEIFLNPDPSRNIFQLVDNLRQALLANDDQALRDALAPLPQASDHLNSMLSFYGNVQSQIREGIDTSARLKLQVETERAQVEDADITESIVQLQLFRFQQEAAMRARAAVPNSSLFDHLR